MNDRQLLQAVLRSDLSAFTAKCFRTLSPGTLYQHNWHIDAITHALTRCRYGEQRRLCITQPPRSLKSICTSVAYAAWLLGHDPTQRIICVSYSQELALELARQFRVIIGSEWYQRLFPRMHLEKDTEAYVVTTQGGGRLATSIGGTLTGRGADTIIIDDPLKAEDAQSDAARKRVIGWYTNTLLSRFNNQQTGVLILVMQRLHEEDLAGHVAETWPTLDLPAIAIDDQQVPIGPAKYYHRKAGDLLHPERLPQVILDQIKIEIGSLAFSAQYQQRPIPVDGNLVKRRWFKYYDRLPTPDYRQIVQSWDVAGSLNGDYSVCTTWLAVKRNYYLIDVWRDRLEFPQLKKRVIQLARQHTARFLLIEKSGLGLSLYDDLRHNTPNGVPVPIGIQPHKDKISRLEGESATIEAGQVWLPNTAPWLDSFMMELLGFPRTKYDDQVDSTSQFLAWIHTHDHHRQTVGLAPVIIHINRPLSPLGDRFPR